MLMLCFTGLAAYLRKAMMSPLQWRGSGSSSTSDTSLSREWELRLRRYSSRLLKPLSSVPRRVTCADINDETVSWKMESPQQGVGVGWMPLCPAAEQVRRVTTCAELRRSCPSLTIAGLPEACSLVCTG